MTLHTDYSLLGDERNIAMSYKKLPEDVEPGAEILIGDASYVLVVKSCHPKTGRSCASAPTTRRSASGRTATCPA